LLDCFIIGIIVLLKWEIAIMKLITKKFVTEEDWFSNFEQLKRSAETLPRVHVVKDLLHMINKSLTMRISPSRSKEPQYFESLLEGYWAHKNGISWKDRHLSWQTSNSKPVAWLGLHEGCFYLTKDLGAAIEEFDLLPIFPHYLQKINLNDIIKEQSSMKALDKDFLDRMLSQNQDAVKMAGKLSVGKAANQILTSKLAGTFPWYAKLFGKHRETVNNPFVRVGTAEAVLAAVEKFYPENEKLKYVAEAMLQEAMSDVALNSNALKSVLNELEALAGHLPGETK
jgi:hypothetical protein